MENSLNKILSFAIIFIIINLVLWGAQELYHHEGTQQIKQIEAWLDNESRSIDALEAKIHSTEMELNRRENELNRLKIIGYTSQYNAGVDSFNFLLSTHKQDIDNYNAKLIAYNAKIDEANALIKKSGVRWYLIPIPFGAGTKPRLPAR